MIKRCKFYFLALIIVGLILGWLERGSIRDWWYERNQPKLPASTTAVETGRGLSQGEEDLEDKEDKEKDQEEVSPNNNQDSSSSSTNIEIPAEINLAVSFTSQSPFSLWDELHEYLCEEASLLMVNRFYQGRGFASKEDANQAMKEIKDFEIKTFGEWKSNTAAEIAQVARDMLNYSNSEAVKLSNFLQIKKEVAQGHPIILPAAGRKLGNPNFTAPGPLYHMLVVRGWLADGRIITNDPGTRKGEGYIYSQDVLWNAIRDWNGGDVNNGDKVMIVVKQKTEKFKAQNCITLI